MAGHDRRTYLEDDPDARDKLGIFEAEADEDFLIHIIPTYTHLWKGLIIPKHKCEETHWSGKHQWHYHPKHIIGGVERLSVDDVITAAKAEIQTFLNDPQRTPPPVKTYAPFWYYNASNC